jgi:ATP-binding cassette subfamily B protein
METNIFASLKPFLKKYFWCFFAVFFFGYLTRRIIETFVIKYIYSQIIDNLTNKFFNWENGMYLFLCYVFLDNIGPLLYMFLQKIRYRLYVEMPNNIYIYYYEKILNNSINYFNDNFAGSISKKMGTYINSLLRIHEELNVFTAVFIITMIAIFLLIRYNYLLAIYLAIWSIIYFGSLFFFFIKMKEKSVEINELDSVCAGQAIDSFTNILNTKTFVRKNFEKSNLKKIILKINKKETEKYWWDCGRRLIDYVLVTSITFIILYKLINLYLLEQITIGEVIFLYTMTSNITSRIKDSVDKMANIATDIGRMKNSLETLEEPSNINNTGTSKEIKLFSIPDIEFKNVTFKYKESLPIVFEDFNLKIDAGTKVGLVGYTGSGKSSFVNLLLRFYDLNKGNILIGGYDIKNDYTQNSLRRNISYIPQEPILFHRTIRENIIYGDIRATNQQIVDACKAAYCYDFIQELENGFETMVGERGVKLSGGQKQRLAISRAILKNSPVLILDEATSALDSITESYIQNALNTLIKGKTTIVVAHRLSTLNNMDRIIVLEKGKVVEDGTHKQLIDLNGRFAKMWKAQKDGMLVMD